MINDEALQQLELRKRVNGIEQRLVALNIGVTLFMPAPFRDCAPHLGQAFAKYLKIVPPTVFRWQNLRGTEAGFKAVSNRTFATLDACLGLRRSYGSRCSIWLKDGEATTDVGDNLFSLYGKDAGASFAQMLFPAAVLDDVAPTAFAQSIHDILEGVPFHSGYAGYTLGVSTLDWSAGHDRDIGAKCHAAVRRFRGVEHFSPISECSEMAASVRPPSWITFLSTGMLGRLGGADGLKARLGDGEFTWRALQHGSSIQCGPAPLLADGDRGEDVSLEQKRLAAILLPLYPKEPPLLFRGRPYEDTIAWLRRHVDEP
jgi:hypothetical protein